MSIVSIPIEIFMSKRPLKEPVLVKIMFRNCIKYRENVTQKTSVRDRKVTLHSEIFLILINLLHSISKFA